MTALLLCSCGASKVPLRPHLTQAVKTIELATVEAGKILLVRRLNPVLAIIGDAGKLMHAITVADQATRYEKRAGPVHQMSIDLFEASLIQALSAQGYEVNSSGKRYWDYFKPSQKDLRDKTDGILRVRLKQLGFWAGGLAASYHPSVVVIIELIDPLSREILYSDRFALGMDVTAIKMMEVSEGSITMLRSEHRSVAYKNFKALLDHAEESREALLETVVLATAHVAKALQGPKPPLLLVHDPVLFESMPGLPLSSQVRGELPH